MASSFDHLKEQLKSKAIVKPFARDVMTIGACPTAPACAWLQDANLRTTSALIPLASDDLKSKMTSLQQDEKRLFDGLQALVTANKLSKDEYTAIEREYQNLLIASEPPGAKARNQARLRYSASEVSKATVALYDIASAIKKNGAERDQAVATAAVAQPGNGIFAMGTRARDSMVPLLESACAAPKKQVKAPVVKSPTVN